jgi:hypothetical protein
MLQPHLTQGHLQLFRNEHRYGGVSALPHLDVRHDQRHRAIATDANESVRRKTVRPCGCRVAEESGQTKAKHETAACGDTAL